MIRFGGPIIRDQAQAAGAGESHGSSADDPILIARAHREKGYTAAYAPKIKLSESDKIRAVRQAFAAEGIMIAEVGYWNNLLDTDPASQATIRHDMLNALALAEELGARCAVNILGSYCHGNGNSQHSAENFTADAFTEAVDLARYFIDSVKPKTAYFCYEIFPFNVVDSPEMIEKLIKAVDRDQFGVHLDLVNLINSPRAYWSSGEIMRTCVRLFGNRIVAAHVKDIKMKEPAISVILEEVISGEGQLDLATFVRELHKLPQQVPMMMEHLKSNADYDRAAAHIRQVARTENILL